MQTEGIARLTELIAELFPVIITVVMIMLVVGIVMNMAGGGKRKRGGILAFVFITSLLLSSLALVVAGVSVSPGSTSVYDGMPVTETFRGLNDTVEYKLVQTIGEDIAADALYADSQGILIISVSPYRSGSNPYTLQNATDDVEISFTIQNNSIMDYLIPLFTIMIMVSVLGLILSIFTGKK